ncbi:uncharacterized protein LOC111282130 [Durio zibethinus]|uniref:Uncharacterized protein LOC111282130 n=1 Tax=Durio zibethinus TaxID=66656 RepID=A0A6P5XD94_DURZI|nr:uncharacterized protein LOC111282130 [Durio zibethinus]
MVPYLAVILVPCFSSQYCIQFTNRRHSLATLSFDPTTSSSLSSSYSNSPVTACSTNTKFVPNIRSNDGCLTDVHRDDKVGKEPTPKYVEIEEKPVVRRQPFWQKLLFTSKKIRSIILLNVITTVYASDIPVIKTVKTIMDPAPFSAARFVMSAIPFLPFVLGARDDVQIRKARIELGLWVSGGYFVEALGLLTADARRASFISLFTFGDLLSFLSAIFFGIHML